jgi:hypothetical protein
MGFKDILVPWKDKKGEVLAERYFHLFTINEFKKIVERVNLKVKDAGFTQRPESKDNNIYLVAEK